MPHLPLHYRTIMASPFDYSVVNVLQKSSYFSTSPERQRAAQELADSYAALADCLVSEHGKSVALICMEELDEHLADKVHHRMVHADRARVFSASTYNASQMTVLLQSIDLLVTSRYHACILSLPAQVPQLAVGHDLRLKTIYDELDLIEEFFMDGYKQNPCVGLRERVEKLTANPALEKESLRRGYEEHIAKAQTNRNLLRSFAQDHGLEVMT